MIWDIYNALIENAHINDLIGDRIKFYEYPEAKNMKDTHIIIDPIDVPKPGDYADNEWLTDDYLYQIDVWSKDLKERDLVASTIRKVLWNKLNIRQFGGNGVDEWDKDYDIYRDARQYRGKKYSDNFNKL
jgi:hypothetical protein